MAPTLESLGIDKLSIDEQLVIAQTIWKRAYSARSTHLSASHIADLEMRLEEDDRTDDSEMIPWEEIQKEADRRFP